MNAFGAKISSLSQACQYFEGILGAWNFLLVA